MSPDFLDKLRVLRELETFHPMGLQAEGTPDSHDGGLREACFLGHEPGAPVSSLIGHGFQCRGDYLLNLRVGDGTRRARPGFTQQAFEAVDPEAVAPLAHRRLGDLQLRGDLLIVETGGTGQNDPSPERHRLGGLGTACQEGEFLGF